MIFDSPEMQILREQYAGRHLYGVPPIVLVDRSATLVQERDFLEHIISEAPADKQKEWLKKRLYSNQWEQYLGGWFEMMLFGWLKQAGAVRIEPDIVGTKPDFLASIGQQEIIVEAKAHPIGPEERHQNDLMAELLYRVEQIPLPYVIQIEALRLEGMKALDTLVASIQNWLNHEPDAPLILDDPQIVFKAYRPPEYDLTTFNAVQVLYSPEAFWIDPDHLRSSLLGKVRRYAPIKQSQYPLVIAYFIESSFFGVDEVVEVWFGKTTYTVDIASKNIEETKCDRTGINYRNSNISKNISGVLVFKRDSSIENRLPLQCWYIENPFANKPIDPLIFPVDSHFIATGRSDRGYEMTWKHIDYAH